MSYKTLNCGYLWGEGLQWGQQGKEAFIFCCFLLFMACLWLVLLLLKHQQATLVGKLSIIFCSFFKKSVYVILKNYFEWLHLLKVDQGSVNRSLSFNQFPLSKLRLRDIPLICKLYPNILLKLLPPLSTKTAFKIVGWSYMLFSSSCTAFDLMLCSSSMGP